MKETEYEKDQRIEDRERRKHKKPEYCPDCGCEKLNEFFSAKKGTRDWKIDWFCTGCRTPVRATEEVKRLQRSAKMYSKAAVVSGVIGAVSMLAAIIASFF